jgi:hypothetical protein
MAIKKIKETDLYPPLKAFWEDLGYEVKAEISDADLMAVKPNEPPVIVELKTRFSLALFHQAIDRQALTDSVYVAVPRRKGRPFQKSMRQNQKLARRLGIGLITVRMATGEVKIYVEPGPFKPRKSKKKRDRALNEFHNRIGDPNTGGTKDQIMTVYRQDALLCLEMLSDNGPTKGSAVAAETGVKKATTLMSRNHYGWFERVEKGIYGLTTDGEKAVEESTAKINTVTP